MLNTSLTGFSAQLQAPLLEKEKDENTLLSDIELFKLLQDPDPSPEVKRIIQEQYSYRQKDLPSTLHTYPSLDNLNGQEIPTEAQAYWILSLDGGGVRGIITAKILSMLEGLMGCKVSEKFNCITGTSTGAILAAGLSKPRRDKPSEAQFWAGDILEMYRKKSKLIFSRSLWHKIRTLWGFWGPKYPKQGLEKTLEERFGHTRIHESVCDLIIPAWNTTKHQPFTFENFVEKQYSKKTAFDPKNDSKFRSQGYSISEAISASTSAPSYFPTTKITDERDYSETTLSDGGLVANNPLLCAYARCYEHYDLKERPVFILSISTGRREQNPLHHEKARKMGLLSWISPLIDTLFEAQSINTQFFIDIIQKAENVFVMRLNFDLDEEQAEMDNCSKENIASLELLAENYFADLLKVGFKEKVIESLRKRKKLPPQSPLARINRDVY